MSPNLGVSRPFYDQMYRILKLYMWELSAKSIMLHQDTVFGICEFLTLNIPCHTKTHKGAHT